MTGLVLIHPNPARTPAGASRGPRRAGEAELEELVQAATVGRLGKPRLREAVCALVVPLPPPV